MSRLQVICGRTCGAVTITSLSARLFGAIRNQKLHPSTQIIVDAAARHHEIYGDAGLLVVALSTSIVDACTNLPVSRHAAIVGNGHALDYIQKALKDLHCPLKIRLDWGNMHAVLSLVRSVIATKPLAFPGLREEDIDYMCVMITKAALVSLADGSTAHPRVRVLPILGPQTLDSKCIAGAVVDTVLPPDLPEFHALRDVRVMLFSESLEMHNSNGFSGVRCTGPSRRYEVEDYDVAHAYVNKCKALGVGLIGSQKGICPVLREIMIDHGIVPLQRLSLRHIYSVQAAAGCILLADISSQISSCSIGMLASVTRRTLGRKQYLVLDSAELGRTVSTIMLTAPDQQTLDELSAVTSAAVRVLAGSIQSGDDAYVLHGAGRTELHLAEILRAATFWPETQPSENIPTEICQVLESFAQCLGKCSRLGTGLSNTTGIVDAFHPKLAAICTAVEVANALLRVDGLVEE